MKTTIFNTAIYSRKRVKFLYGLKYITVEPYYISVNRNGNKSVYGRVSNTNEIKMFEYNKIFNLKVLDRNRFSPVIPIVPVLN